MGSVRHKSAFLPKLLKYSQLRCSNAMQRLDVLDFARGPLVKRVQRLHLGDAVFPVLNLDCYVSSQIFYFGLILSRLTPQF